MDEASFSGSNRKRELSRSKAAIVSMQSEGRRGLRRHFGWLDSPLDGSQGYRHTFSGVLPEEALSLQDFILGALANRKGKAIFVEFGGPGSKIAAQFPKKFFKASFGVTIADHRNPEFPFEAKGQKEDKKRRHTIVEGDILNTHTYDLLSKQLKDEQVDLILSRMLLGLELMPKEPYELAKLLERWYGMLREGGIMLIQVPNALRGVLEAWATKTVASCGDTLVVRTSSAAKNDGAAGVQTALYLEKKKGAPKELPMLSHKELKTLRLKPTL